MMQRILFISVLTVLLQACSFSGATPPEEHFYRLPLATTEQVSSEALYQNVSVKSVQADGIYNERAMLYVEDSSPLEVRRYHYHYWLTTPARLIQEQFKSYLSAQGMARQLASTTTDQQLALTLRVANFERLVGSQNRVLVALDLSAQRAGASAPALEKSYRVELPAGTTMHDSAAAFGQALNRIFDDISADLSALKK